MIDRWLLSNSRCDWKWLNCESIKCLRRQQSFFRWFYMHCCFLKTGLNSRIYLTFYESVKQTPPVILRYFAISCMHSQTTQGQKLIWPKINSIQQQVPIKVFLWLVQDLQYAQQLSYCNSLRIWYSREPYVQCIKLDLLLTKEIKWNKDCAVFLWLDTAFPKCW